MGNVIKTVYSDQEDILLSILKLRGLDRFDCDCTYGNGSFYSRSVPEPRYKFDLDPQKEGVVQCCSSKLPLDRISIESLVFDPPFLTYVRQGREGNGSMVMAKKYGGYWRYEELAAHYQQTMEEAYRILTYRGTLVIKCQDIVHNHRLHPTHINVVRWAKGMFRLADLFILVKNRRMPSPQAGKQRHARIHHSYFLVMERLK